MNAVSLTFNMWHEWCQDEIRLTSWKEIMSHLYGASFNKVLSSNLEACWRTPNSFDGFNCESQKVKTTKG
jgi:hypothetical protein